MKKILITGWCGFVWRHLTKRLSQDPNNQITIIDNLSTGSKLEDWPNHLKCDVYKVIYWDCLEYFTNNIEDYFDEIFHLAAIVEWRLAIENEALKVSKDLMIDSAMFYRATKVKPGKIIYFSSSAVYPIRLQTKENNLNLKEEFIDVSKDLIEMPDMSYGWAKMTGEYLSYLAHSKYWLNIAVYRPFSGYWEDQAMTYPTPSIIQRVIDSIGDVIVWGSGEQSRDFIYIEDCISGILQTYTKINDWSPINLWTWVKTTFKEFINQTAEVLWKTVNIVPLLDKPEWVFARYCDRSKQDELWFVPQYSLKDWIKIVADYLQFQKIDT